MRRVIPHYKRDKYIFISNLNTVTADKDFALTLKRDGYLLSEYYTDDASVEQARYVKYKRNLLISDNGNFSRMKRIAKLFEKKGFAILNKAISETNNMGEVSSGTLEERKKIIIEINEACSHSSIEVDNYIIVETQLKINPDYLIGLEDFNITVMMLCGLLHPVFNPNVELIKIHQSSSVKLFNKQVNGDFGNKEKLELVNKFIVLHSYDYSSAYQAVKIAEDAKAEGYAVSFGGPMKSKRWISSINLGNRTMSFKEKLPESYLIATAIAKGTNDAMDSNMPLHILGVGTPILIALIGGLFNKSRAISIDSTAPFKDAYAGTLYGSKTAFLKMDMNKVAAYQLINNKAFISSTPFFKYFEKSYPSNWSKLRTILGISSSSNVKEIVNDLKSNQALVEEYIPFFTKLRGGGEEKIEMLRKCRAGHNYWILKNICNSVRNRMDDKQKMDKWIDYQVDRYTKVAHKKWNLAVQYCIKIAREEL